MRTAVWGALAVAVAAAVTPASGGTLAPRAAAPVAASPVAPSHVTVTAIWRVVRAAPASREVDLTFFAAACSAVKRILVDESPTRVVVTLDMAGREGKDCTEPFVRHREVRLAAPLGTRALYDGGVAPPALVRAGG
jgi:hypothetical protein